MTPLAKRELVRTAYEPRRLSRGGRLRGLGGVIFRLSGRLLPFLWVLAALALNWPGPAGGAELPRETGAPEVPSGPVNFDTCVQLALRQSPFLTKSALEIEVRRLDEADSKSDFLPTVNFRTRYYPSRPSEARRRDSQDYSVDFTSDPFNPVEAHFSLKVRKIVTQIAILGHLKVIAESLHRLGQGFLELKSLEDLARLQGELAQVARENLRYQRERQKLGEVTPLEVQIAAQEGELAAAEQERLLASREKIREGIRAYLALKPGQPLQLDLNQARRQVLGDFEPAQASLEEAKDRSFDLRIQKLAQELQSWNVVLAKVRLLPNFNFGVQTPDPLSVTDVRGYFFWVGVNFPIFDGFKRLRNIKRQKTVLKQFASEVEVKDSDITEMWREALAKVQSSAAGSRLAKAQVELARLKERQGETLYRSGGEALPILLTARKTAIQSQMQQVHKALEYDLTALGLRHLSGELVYRYVNEAQFKP